MMRKFVGFVVASLIIAITAATPALAALAPHDDSKTGTDRVSPADNAIDARQFKLKNVHVAGHESVRQNVTAWKVASGSWNGESLAGLSLVLVQSTSDNGQFSPTTNCYISHLATLAQRNAMVSAFLAANSLTPSDAVSWRFEPGIIRLDVNGETVVIHIGLVA